MRACLLLVLATATAAAAPRYPVRVPQPGPADLARRADAFRARNPQHWLTVEVEPHGFVKHVVTDDPALVPHMVMTDHGVTWRDADVAKVRALVRANADLFGVPPSAVDRLRSGGGPNLLLVDTLDGAPIGEIQAQGGAARLDISVLFWVDVAPKVSQVAVARRVIGQTYTATFGYGAPPALDCAMTPLGAAGCRTPITHRVRRVVTPGARQVRATTWLHEERGAIRLVRCAEVVDLAPPAPAPGWGRAGALGNRVVVTEQTLTPHGAAPRLPLVVDAVTGQTLHLHVASCTDPALSNLR